MDSCLSLSSAAATFFMSTFKISEHCENYLNRFKFYLRAIENKNIDVLDKILKTVNGTIAIDSLFCDTSFWSDLDNDCHVLVDDPSELSFRLVSSNGRMDSELRLNSKGLLVVHFIYLCRFLSRKNYNLGPTLYMENSMTLNLKNLPASRITIDVDVELNANFNSHYANNLLQKYIEYLRKLIPDGQLIITKNMSLGTSRGFHIITERQFDRYTINRIHEEIEKLCNAGLSGLRGIKEDNVALWSLPFARSHLPFAYVESQKTEIISITHDNLDFRHFFNLFPVDIINAGNIFTSLQVDSCGAVQAQFHNYLYKFSDNLSSVADSDMPQYHNFYKIFNHYERIEWSNDSIRVADLIDYRNVYSKIFYPSSKDWKTVDGAIDAFAALNKTDNTAIEVNINNSTKSNALREFYEIAFHTELRFNEDINGINGIYDQLSCTRHSIDIMDFEITETPEISFTQNMTTDFLYQNANTGESKREKEKSRSNEVDERNEVGLFFRRDKNTYRYMRDENLKKRMKIHYLKFVKTNELIKFCDLQLSKYFRFLQEDVQYSDIVTMELYMWFLDRHAINNVDIDGEKIYKYINADKRPKNLPKTKQNVSNKLELPVHPYLYRQFPPSNSFLAEQWSNLNIDTKILLHILYMLLIERNFTNVLGILFKVLEKYMTPVIRLTVATNIILLLIFSGDTDEEMEECLHNETFASVFHSLDYLFFEVETSNTFDLICYSLFDAVSKMFCPQMHIYFLCDFLYLREDMTSIDRVKHFRDFFAIEKKPASINQFASANDGISEIITHTVLSKFVYRYIIFANLVGTSQLYVYERDAYVQNDNKLYEDNKVDKCMPNNQNNVDNMVLWYRREIGIWNLWTGIFDRMSPALFSPIKLKKNKIPSNCLNLIDVHNLKLRNFMFDRYLKAVHFIRYVHYQKTLVCLLSNIYDPNMILNGLDLCINHVQIHQIDLIDTNLTIPDNMMDFFFANSSDNYFYYLVRWLFMIFCQLGEDNLEFSKLLDYTQLVNVDANLSAMRMGKLFDLQGEFAPTVKPSETSSINDSVETIATPSLQRNELINFCRKHNFNDAMLIVQEMSASDLAVFSRVHQNAEETDRNSTCSSDNNMGILSDDSSREETLDSLDMVDNETSDYLMNNYYKNRNIYKFYNLLPNVVINERLAKDGGVEFRTHFLQLKDPKKIFNLIITLLSWFIRCVHEHAYSDTKFFKFIANHRQDLYNHLQFLVQSTCGKFIINKSINDLSNVFTKFCECTHLIDNLKHPSPPFGFQLNCPELDHDIHNVYYDDLNRVFVNFIIQAQFNSEVFVDLLKYLCRITAPINSDRLALLITNCTGTGGTEFTKHLLNNVFNLPNNYSIIYTHKELMACTKGNSGHKLAADLNRSLLIVFNNVTSLNNAFKTITDNGTLYQNDMTLYQINANIIITTNDNPTCQDESVINRLRIFPRIFQFVGIDSNIKIARKNSTIDIELGSTHPVLGIQILTEKQPRHNGSFTHVPMFAVIFNFATVFHSTIDCPFTVTCTEELKREKERFTQNVCVHHR